MAELRIQAYSDEKGASPKGTAFKAIINPASIQLDKSIRFNNSDRSDTPGHHNPSFQGYEPENLSFELILDGTGYAGTKKTADAQLTELKKIVYELDPGIHKACYVMISYGPMHFFGHLSTMGITYELWDKSGSPIRIKTSLKFVSHKDKYTGGKNLASPDMTHLHLIDDGDKITNICHDIYDDISYYIQIAELNNLTNFRKVNSGNRVAFPPLINK